MSDQSEIPDMDAPEAPCNCHKEMDTAAQVVDLWHAVGVTQFHTMATGEQLDRVESAVKLVSVGLVCVSLSILIMLQDQGRG